MSNDCETRLRSHCAYRQIAILMPSSFTDLWIFFEKSNQKPKCYHANRIKAS